jgi:1-acyl-sn-glycerol-3-phosphate acyltransferase
VIRLVIFIAVTVINTIINAFLSIVGGLFNPYSRFNSCVIRIWAKIILLVAGVKLKIEGPENIVPEESYIVVANHQSLMDIPVLASGLPVPIRFIAKKELFKIPVLGWGMKAAGMLEIDRANQKQSFDTLKKAEQVVRHHHLSILAFPEGTRSDDGKVHNFKKGPFILAINTGLSIIPVSVSGTRNLIPKGKIQINPGGVKIQIHAPVSVADLKLSDRNQLVSKIQKMITEGFVESYK